MNCEQKYQGWNTYETWIVALWLDNEWLTYHRSREIAYQCWNAAAESERVIEWNWSRRDAATAELADLLSKAVSEGRPLGTLGMYEELLTAAMSEVDWKELAENLIDEVTQELVLKVKG